MASAAGSKIGTAYQFTAASSQSLSRADDANLSTGDVDFTIAAWVWGDSFPNHATVISKRSADEYILEYTTGGADFRFFFGQNNIAIESGGTFSTGTWYHVVFWHDSVNNLIGISVNAGTPATASDAGASAVDGAGSLQIGDDAVFGHYWDGRLNQVALWKRVLTGAERTSLYNGGSGLPFASWGGAAFPGDEDEGIRYLPRVNW